MSFTIKQRELNVQKCTVIYTDTAMFCLHTSICEFISSVLTNKVIPQVELIWFLLKFLY